MKNLLSLGILLAASATFAQTPSDWKTIDDTKFEIQFPADWDLDQSGSTTPGGPAFVLFVKKNDEQVFRGNINLLIQNLQGLNIDLNGFVNLSEQQISTMLPNSKIIESKRVQLPDAHHVIVFEGDQSNFRLKWKQYYWVLADKAYVLTLTTKSDAYESIIPTADKILNSFKIKK